MRKFSFASPRERRDNHQDVTNSSLNIWFEAFDHERDIEPIKEKSGVDTNGVEYSDGSIGFGLSQHAYKLIQWRSKMRCF